MERHVGGWHIFNPGSVGVPLDGEHSASYMILDGDSDGWTLAAHRRVPFDLAPLLAEYERQDFVARCGVTGALIIAEFRTARLQVLPYLNWKESHYPDRDDNLELLQEFLGLDEQDDYLPPEYRGLTSDLYRD